MVRSMRLSTYSAIFKLKDGDRNSHFAAIRVHLWADYFKISASIKGDERFYEDKYPRSTGIDSFEIFNLSEQIEKYFHEQGIDKMQLQIVSIEDKLTDHLEKHNLKEKTFFDKILNSLVQGKLVLS